MAGRKAGTPRSDRTRNAKARGLADGAVVPAQKPGPEPWEPTAEQVEQIKSLAGRGVGIREISMLIGVDKNTLHARAQEAIDAGRAVGIATITGVVFAEARKGNYRHAAMYLQQVAGWSTRQQVEHSGPGGGAIRYTVLTGVPEAESGDDAAE